MQGIPGSMLIDLVGNFGIPGIIFIIWYLGEKSHERTLAQYQKDMQEARRMYEDNLKLAKDYSRLARDLKTVLVANTRALTRLSDDVNKNQYCPFMRMDRGKVHSLGRA